jgi:hypothetical protein
MVEIKPWSEGTSIIADYGTDISGAIRDAIARVEATSERATAESYPLPGNKRFITSVHRAFPDE